MSTPRWARRTMWGLLASTLLILSTIYVRGISDLGDPIVEMPAPQAHPDRLVRGAYLAKLGDCAACHTARGGTPYAGGRGIDTPFGTVYSSNLTPDNETGLGRWSATQFYRAMHHGRSADGRLLLPAFPYPNFTQVSRDDSDQIYLYLRSLPATHAPNRPHALGFPYNTQFAQALWRGLFFTPGPVAQRLPRTRAQVERGAYLVQGLGHCNACHAARNALGATAGPLDLGGGVIPVQNWYAPSLTSSREAGLSNWTDAQVVALLKTGRNEHRAVSGPMAEVVQQSTQHATEADLYAMAAYLRSRTRRDAEPPPRVTVPPTPDPRGARLYGDHCASCHGDRGQGVAHAYPRLADSRAVTLDPPANLVRIVVAGGFPPATDGNPRPFGMPPFATTLNDQEVALVLSYIRASWGNSAQPVTTLDVTRYRATSQR